MQEDVMSDQEITAELLAFFKALSDENRLKIVGLLAQQPYSVEKLAEALGLGVSTTSHHLSRLSKAGLVSVQVDGHYYIYSLQTGALQNMAQRLLHDETLPKLSSDASEDAYDRKVLENFLDKQGRIKSFPSQEKKLMAILRHVIKVFQPGERYTEKQVNELLSAYSEDTAMLRRSLVDAGMLQRKSSGDQYWLPEPTE
jgi:predicted transcriptional regulator